MIKKIELTKEGFEKLKLELDQLKKIERPRAVDLLQKARSMGDLSENSAYHSAREGLAMIEGKILETEEIIKSSIIIEKNNSINQVSLGSTVVVESNGNKDQYKIVGEFEADPINKKLSSTSPLGSGFLGKKVGDSVEIQIPAGKVVYNIIEIK